MRHNPILVWLLVTALSGCAPETARRTRIVVAVPTVPQSPYPHLELEEYSTTILANVYDGLVRQEGDLSVSPSLASSWENPDDTTWIFRLRDGVLLHDGRTLEAAHVVDSYLRTQNDARSEYGPGRRIKSIRALDPKTVRVETLEPVHAATTFAIGVAIESEDPRGPPVGTGAYRLASLREDRSAVLHAFPDHWEGSTEVDVLEFRASLDPRERLTWLREGEADLVPAISIQDAISLDAQPSIRVESSAGLRVVFLGMRCQPNRTPDEAENPFTDSRVRTAVAHAIDRQALLQIGPFSSGEVVDQILAPEVWGYIPEVSEIRHDPDLSRRLLAEAGFSGDLEVVLDYPKGKYIDIERVAEMVAADLTAVGIPTRTNPTTVEQITRGEPAPTWLLGWMTTGGGLHSYELLFHSPNSGLGTFNLTGFHSEELDTFMDRARALPPEKRLPLVSQIAKEIRSAMPIVPLYRELDQYGLNADLIFKPRLDRRLLGKELGWQE